MPPLAASFAAEVSRWVDLARSGEVVRAAAAGNRVVLSELRPARLEALYEVAFLRVFLSWEVYLEESFTRLLCGYEVAAPGLTLAGNRYALQGAAYSTLPAASQALLAGNPHISWADPDAVIRRSRTFVKDGPHETVLRSAKARLLAFTDIRNRIAHPSANARQGFDAATAALVGRRYRGASPGRFLRDWETTLSPPERMLMVLARELVGLAGQVTR
jgi:hypothetical protein